MRKKILLSILISLTSFFVFSSHIIAQTNNQSQAWICAKTTWCTGDNYQEGTCTVKIGHRVRLEVDPNNQILPNNNETYLVECISYSKNNQIDWFCTTGDSQLDLTAFNSDNFSQLSSDIQYSLARNENYGIYRIDNNQAIKIGSKAYKTGPSRGLMIKDDNTPISVFEWQSYTSQAYERKFYFFQKIPVFVDPGVGTGGQQQATSFDWINADKDCAIIRWDPAGRVFDAYSLEPIPMASVFLTKDTGDGQFVAAQKLELGIINPQITNPQGNFSYFVSDGDYKLNILNVSSLGYLRIADSLADINPNYENIYYHLENGVKKTYLYPTETEEIIQQRGKIQYRDIPLIPSISEGKSYNLVLISGFQSVDRLTGNFLFEGSVSHPFTTISIYGVKMDNDEELVIQEAADNFGRYKILFPQTSKGVSYKEFRVSFDKVDLRSIVNSQSKSHLEKLIGWLKNKFLVFSQEKKNNLTFILKPIPTYIEGIAYDEKGNILSNQEIIVYVEGNNFPYSSVKTDEKGYYKLASNRLPNLPYYLKYKLPTGLTRLVTTSEVINENKNLLTSSKVSYYTLKNEQGELITPIVKKNNSLNPSLSRSQANNYQNNLVSEKNNPSKNKINRNAILIIILIIGLVLITGGLIFFYLRQRQTNPPYSEF